MSESNNKLIQIWIQKLINHFREKNFKIDPLPRIRLVATENAVDNILISTGDYDPIEKIVRVSTTNRHIKDILRSFCHEMIHHHQNLVDPEFATTNTFGKIEENPALRKVEMEAFLLGNLYFRTFTEKFKV